VEPWVGRIRRVRCADRVFGAANRALKRFCQKRESGIWSAQRTLHSGGWCRHDALNHRWSFVTAKTTKPTQPAKPVKSAKKAPLDREHDNERLIADNRRSRREYEVLDTLECGIVLVGSEVKSLRKGQLTLDDAYGRITAGEVFLIGCDIPEYVQANQFNHNPKRPRKLLMHRREIKKFASRAFEKGLTLVPLKMYFKEGRAKVLLGICKGRQLHDKRQVLKAKDMKRDIDRAMRRA
jgi:SsrA-binding protein